MWRFLRPRGTNSSVHAKRVAPKSVGFRKHLYSYPRPENPAHQETIEREFLQIIDSKGAAALSKVEANQPLTPNDKAALSQFVLSLMHRSPGRIDFITKELGRRIENPDWTAPDDFVRHHALSLFSGLVASDLMISGMIKMLPFIINIGDHKNALLTSDRPTIISDGLHHDNSFVMLPIAPRRLLLLAHREEVPEAFAIQKTGALITALNDAIVSQAEGLVIGSRPSESWFIEKRLNRPDASLQRFTSASDGLIRWRAPI